jgi:molybdate transport system substrate-binding protein
MSLFRVLFGFVALAVPPKAASASDIRVWTARALATVLAEVGHEFERATGHRLIVSSGLPTEFARRSHAGEAFDLFISGSTPVDEWIRAGRLISGTRTDLARSGIGVEVRAGAAHPDISTVDAFRRTLLAARSIAYLPTGSGVYLASLFQKLGVADAVNAKATRPDTDIVSEMVAQGKVELGLVVITQILTTPGVALVGPLPDEIQSYVTFTAAVSATSPVADAARALIRFLQSPAAVTVMRAQGMEPALRQ